MGWIDNVHNELSTGVAFTPLFTEVMRSPGQNFTRETFALACRKSIKGGKIVFKNGFYMLPSSPMADEMTEKEKITDNYMKPWIESYNLRRTDKCFICMEEDLLLTSFFNCGHKQCHSCFAKWDKRCPMCRKDTFYPVITEVQDAAIGDYVGKNFTCKLCPFKNTNLPSLFAHIEDSHGVYFVAGKTKCPKCDKRIYMASSLASHIIACSSDSLSHYEVRSWMTSVE